MKLEKIDIGSVSLDPANVRKHDRRNLDAIKASLRKFGQQKPIVIDGNGIVIAGNGTLTAAQELGWTEILAVRTQLVGSAATAFAIADNRTAELAQWDDDALNKVMASLKVEDAELALATGIDPSEAEKSLSDVEAPDEFAEVDENIDTEHECPKCGYKWSGKPN